jgi:hypothetical protein
MNPVFSDDVDKPPLLLRLVATFGGALAAQRAASLDGDPIVNPSVSEPPTASEGGAPAGRGLITRGNGVA